MEDYTRYTGMAFELLAIILVMVFMGRKIDQWMHNSRPIALALLVLVGMVGYMIKIYYETQRRK